MESLARVPVLGAAAWAAVACVTAAAVLVCAAAGCRAEVARSADAPEAGPIKAVRVYVGTYTGPKSKGIYLMTLDTATGRLSEPQVAGETTNPSFVALAPGNRFLYAVSEVWGAGGKAEAAVCAFAVDPATGLLAPLNKQPTLGKGACHVSVSLDGRHVLAANYGSGSACVMPIGPDGRLGEVSSNVQHSGSGPNPKRQEGPHAHSINLDPTGRLALVADLGLDKVMLYNYDAARGTLAPHDPAFIGVAPGAGPRHLAFHPNGRVLYVINEMANTMTVFAYDAAAGAFRELQTLSTLPPHYQGQNTTAEVQVHPSGRFVYGSNRGHDSIAFFAVKDDGTLEPRGHASTLGKGPRNFGIDPTGAYVVAANQGSDSVVSFRIDPKTGGLTPVGEPVTVGAPVCVKFVAVR
jgi:6-phosphogluconolactonase